MDIKLNTPLTREDTSKLNAGDYVYLSGTIYTARDAAHARMNETLDKGESLPVDWKNNIVYYLGPTPARPGKVIGSAGPTTASRMDKYAPRLLDMGLIGMIGKGKRTQEVLDAVVRNALLSKCIKKAEVVAYDDLGTEAIRKLTVENLPVIVVADSKGNNLYETATEKYKK